MGKSSIQFSENTNPNSTKHLGLPLNSGDPMKIHFKEVLEKIQMKLGSWKTKLLSQANRTTLIKIVANAIPSYTMSSLWIPTSVAKKNIDQALFDASGLGIRKTSNFNKDLLSKLGWHLISNEKSLWKTVLSAKYLKRTN
ncbi:hypothetical protein I3760_01G043700 [Carya illinoinensis]|nr:hypothetical protein I3760_01G043700 [Carya illinoinensis]